MITLIIFLLIISVLIIVHELGHFLAARRIGVRVEKFSLGFGPELLKKKKKDTEYSLSAIPLGGYVKLAGDSLEECKGKSDEYYSKAPGKRFWVVFSGPLLNYVLGFICFWVIFISGYPALTTKIGGLLDGFGAKEAGLQVADKITSVDGKPVTYWEDLQKIIQSKRGAETVNLTVMRDNKEFKLDVRIRQKQLNDQLGQKRSVGLLGIAPFDEVVILRYSPLKAFVLGVNRTIELSVLTYKGLWRMVSGKLSLRESATGIIGIYYITSKTIPQGILALLQLMALVSVSLALFNLLPLPLLDGGHLFLLLIEKIRGKPLSIKSERVISQVGWSLLMTLVVLVTFNDLQRFYGDKIIQFTDKMFKLFQ